MSYRIEQTDEYKRRLKRLAKKYRSLKTDLSALYDILERDPEHGVQIRPQVRKVRVAIKSKGKGKSGGARVLTYLIVPDRQDLGTGTVYLLTIYDKSTSEALSERYIDDLVRQIGEE